MSQQIRALRESSFLGGGNVAYIEAQYELYLDDPNSVSERWRSYFQQLPIVGNAGSEISHARIRDHFLRLGLQKPFVAGAATEAASEDIKQIHVSQLINAYRQRGHQLADVDPLNRRKKPDVQEIKLTANGLRESDLDTVFQTPTLEGIEQARLRDIIAHLEKCYCGSIGHEFLYIDVDSEKQWLMQRIERVASSPKLDPETQRWGLERITAAEGMERYLHSKYVGQKRFSLEGGESLILALSEIVNRAGDAGVKDLAVGMAHRGRLNVLVNILGKRTAVLFDEFEGKGKADSLVTAGDVKYHQGFSSDIETSQGIMHLALAFNPSHLEIVSPVVEGSVRSRQDRYGDSQGRQAIPVIIHGDAAFAGQGVVMETFNMAGSRGFSTKGTVHIIVNNQIGFTTSNLEDSRSTHYASDVAKMINAPIFHVNGDDPEAVMFATQLAFDFRMQFRKDVVLDIICYRRHGHNEADEPSATQPMMYKTIKALKTTRELYAQRLEREGVIAPGEGDAMVRSYRDRLDAGEGVGPGVLEKLTKKADAINWLPHVKAELVDEADTRMDREQIKALALRQTELPEGFKLHPRVKKIIDDRRKMAAGALPADWGFAENLAYATLLEQGYAVRLSGQDCGRGTFFHRHAVLHNQNDGSAYVPLRKLSDDQANFLVIDSVLSEEAVLAFEYGYATTDPTTLVIWEAQFGDFANGAQVVIDQFISSGEAKWGRLCGLTLFLPHGYEGQGPEHSSARLERFLQLCAENNMQVVVPSTPAQAYHMIRRQMVRDLRRPLIVMTPKSLLRHRLAVSTLEELSDGTFETVIDDVDVKSGAEAEVTRLVLCSGKVYYDLLERRRKEALSHTAVVRIEQLYPFPYAAMERVIARYPSIKQVVWTQEEPRNQGAWRLIRHRLERVSPRGVVLEYAGRAPSPSPAVGYAHVHGRQQTQLVEESLGIIENSQSNQMLKSV